MPDKISNRKKYKLSQRLIAKYLGYANTRSFNSSSARDRILIGIDRIIEHIEQAQHSQITTVQTQE